MAVISTRVLGLGNFAELDTNETTTGANLANLMLNQTFGTSTNPLWAARTTMTMNDGNNNGTIPFTDKTPSATEYVTFGSPAGPARSIDAGVRYNATITYWDGTTATGTVRILQDGTGNLYLLPPPSTAPNAEVTALTQKPIQSIKINSIAQNDYDALETSRFGLPDDPTFPCFVAGSFIRTAEGETRVEDLAVGDLVLTADGDFAPIRWIGSRRLDASVLAQGQAMRPIRIGAGALGNGCPESDLLISPQHRILIRSRISQRMFHADEVLVAAKHLCGIPGVDVADDIETVEYFHLLFDQHQVVFANGTETESLYTGAEALSSIGEEARVEIFALFPELAEAKASPPPARPLVEGRKGRRLAARHARNHQPLMEAPQRDHDDGIEANL